MSGSNFSIPLLHNSVGIMTPFLLAGIGGLMTELAGMLNIALEGLILIGAFSSVVCAAWTGSLFAGILLGLGITVLFSALFGAVTLYLRANLFITGLATNLLAGGLTTVLSHYLFGTKGVLLFQEVASLPVLSIDRLNSIPVLGDILLGHSVLVYAGWLAVILSSIVIYRTPFGYRLRGTGSNPEALIAAGLNPNRYRMISILISGLACGLAGAVLTLSLGAYVPNISAGRGWIALVLIYLGGKTPFGVFAAAFIFGLAESFSNYAQGFLDIPADFILAFPYLITVTAMVIVSVVQYNRTRPQKR